MFTDEQKKSAARWLLTMVGGIVAGWAAKSGFISSEQVLSFFTSEVIVGAVVTAISSGIALAWSMFRHTDKGEVAAVDALAKNPGAPVKAVIMEPNSAGREIADSIPGNTTVVAGSPTAVNVARAA